MATAKAERLLNLVIALVNAPRFRTAAWIRERVAGYGDAPTEEAFFRMFERDKVELRELGIPLQTSEDPRGDGDELGSDDKGTAGYRIPPGEFALPPVSFTPAETTALGLAARLWETSDLSAAGAGAMRKIREAGATDDLDPADEALAAGPAGLLPPRVRTTDAAFAPLYAAVQARRVVTFDYRKRDGGPDEPRSVEPWGLVSHGGRWYLVGNDRHRKDRRTFRLSRIVGDVKATGRAGAVTVPAGLDLLDLVTSSTADSRDSRSARLLVRRDRGDGLRRIATSVRPADRVDRESDDWDEVVVPIRHVWDSAREIAAGGPDVVVLDPADLRSAVVRLLRAAAQTHSTGAPS